MSEEKHFYIGIDLGTTNSSMHWGAIDPITKRAEPRPLSFDQQTSGGTIERRVLLPSFIWFKQGETSPIVGEYAKTKGLEAQNSRVARGVKNHMGQGDWRHEVNNQRYSPSDLSSLILKTLFSGIRKTWGDPVTDVVITVPASFDSDMRADTLEAARLAGFKTTEKDGSPRNLLLDEPRAALYDFLNQQLAGHIPPGILDLSTPKIVLVFDLGGGTLDVSLHKVQQSSDLAEFSFEDLAISRYTQLGGGVFDQLIANELQQRFESKAKLRLDALPVQERNEVRVKLEVQAEHIKQRLTTDIEDRIGKEGIGNIPDDFSVDIYMPFIYDNKGLITKLTKREFELIIAPLLGDTLDITDVDKLDNVAYNPDNIIYPILDVLNKAKRHFGEIPKVDAVILNGGMTRVHAVRERLQKFFGLKPITVLDPEHAVSRGAAVYHYLLHRGWKPHQILAESIGVEVEGSQIFHLVPAGTVLPHKQIYMGKFYITTEGASSLSIPLYRGEKRTPEPPNKKILERRFVFERPQALNTPITVEISIDENKIVKFVASLSTGERAEVIVGAEEIAKDSVVIKPKSTTNASPQVADGQPIDPKKFRSDFLNAASQWDEVAVKNLGLQALRAQNIPDLIRILMDDFNITNRVGRQRIVWMLGHYGLTHHNDPQMNRIIDTCINGIRSSLNNPQTVSTVGRNAVVSLGKIGSSIAESHLINLMDDSKTEPIRGDILISIGKCAVSINAVQHIRRSFTSDREGERINSLWAIGRIGGREHKPIIPIKDLYDLIPEIGQRTDTKTESHANARQYAVYALGEIGDRRGTLGHVDIIDQQHADYILEVISRVQKQISTKASVESPKNDVYRHTLRFTEIANKQVKGEILTADDNRVLMGIRSLMGIAEEE